MLPSSEMGINDQHVQATRGPLSCLGYVYKDPSVARKNPANRKIQIQSRGQVATTYIV